MLHDRRYFYKYATAETALLILQNHTLKYSSPVIFNDPFDTQTRIDYDFEISKLADAFSNEIYKMIDGETEPVGDENHPLFRMIKLTRQNLKNSSKRLPRDFCKQIARNYTSDEIKLRRQYIDGLNFWWKRVVKASRVFCIAEEHDNLLMWAHYTKDHTGAVIKFECLPKLDTPLCAAMKVIYVTKPPTIAKLDEFIKHHTGQDTSILNHDLLFSKMVLSKSIQWMYEKEWRVVMPPEDIENPVIPKDSDGNEILFYLMTLRPQEIHSIYRGCKMSGSHRKKIESCLNADFRHVKMYDCIQGEKEYKLEFKEITG